MELIDQMGEYYYRSFVGSKGTWTLIGTRCQVNYTNPMLCIDEFKSDKGKIIEMKREEVYEWFMAGKIKALPESEIIFIKRTRKEAERLIVRRSV